MASENDPRGKRDRQPLMRINRDRIRQLDPAHQITVLIRKHGRRSIGTVHMHPQMIFAAHCRDRCQIIHNAGVRRPSRRHYTEWHSPRLPILLYCFIQFCRIHLQIASQRHPPQGLPSDAKQPCRLIQRVMRLSGSVENRRSADRSHAIFDGIWKMRRQCQRESTEISLIAAAREGPAELLAPPHSLRNPANRLEFDFRSQLRPGQCCQLRIQRSHQCFRQKSHVRRRRIHQAEVVRARHVKSLVHHLAENFIQYANRIVPQLGQGIVQGSKSPLIGRQLNRPVRKGREVPINLVNEPVTQFAASLGIEVETHTHWTRALRKRRTSAIRKLWSNSKCGNPRKCRFHYFFSVSSVPSVVPAFSGRSSGNRITSRIVCEFVSSIASRSTPTPTPPAGGIPYDSARM